jgi:hypothetical protein
MRQQNMTLDLWRRPAVYAAVATLLASCGDPARVVAPADIRGVGAPLASVAAGVIDVGGAWSWHEEVVSIMPREIALLIGLEPEGNVTHVTCTDFGAMTLAQTGATFTGTATQTSLCRTRGGQQFSPFPPELAITDGRIAGRSLHFDFGGCAYHAVAAPAGGVAVRLEGTGICPVDLHPALLKTVTWDAVRP